MDLTVDYSSLLLELERQELESHENCSSRVYEQMLAIYLATNDYQNAKFLWKRIPSEIKKSSQEIQVIWNIGKNLIKYELSSVYELIASYEWPQYLNNIIKYLREEVKKRSLQTISKSYSYICFEDCMKMTGITDKEEAIKLAESMKWEVDLSFGFFLPKKSCLVEDNRTSNQEQLEKLAEYVAFLENY